ncbi:hypothetical protein [Piscirickettsia salmonis]|uniref:hypothetical protein n=1 Tax=Piscirickettsia salmonis TaxID=1238 RepID=UPI0018ACF5CA|nr:hypothetical protein [Piscirickettsia salmonis]QGP62037.1 hypothetical protein PsalBI1_04679 [Piscirickettsia salmonis]
MARSERVYLYGSELSTGCCTSYDGGRPLKCILCGSQLRRISTQFGLTLRKRRYLGRYFAHPMMQNRRAKRDDYKSSAVRVTQRYVP